MARLIALMTLAALGLSGGPVHEPVHVSEPCFHTAATMRNTAPAPRHTLPTPP